MKMGVENRNGDLPTGVFYFEYPVTAELGTIYYYCFVSFFCKFHQFQ